MEKLSILEELNIGNGTKGHNLFLIQGVAGSGKSLLIKQLLAADANNFYSKEDRAIPISLSATAFFKKYSCNIEIVYKSLCPESCLKQKESDAAIDFYIDGLDELTESSHRKSLLQSIKQHHRSEKIRFFITSRIIEEVNPSFPDINRCFKTICIAGLTAGEKTDMVTNHLKSLISREDLQFLLEQISGNPIVDTLIGTPGFLLNACMEYKGALQQRKHETILRGRDSEIFCISNLYKESVKYILEEKEIIRGDKNRFRGLIKHVDLLYEIAAAMFLSCEGDKAKISATGFDRTVENYCEEHGIDKQYMKRQIQDSNLLCLTDNNTAYQFIQPYFEGYFLAEYLHAGKNIKISYDSFERYFKPSIFTEGEFFIFRLRECYPGKFYSMRCQEMLRFYVNRLDIGDAERFLHRIAHLAPVNIQMDYNPCNKICGNLFDTFDCRNFLLALDLMKYVKQEIDDEPFTLFVKKIIQNANCSELQKQSFLIQVCQQNSSIFSKAVARTLWMHEEDMQQDLSGDMQQLFYDKNWPSELFSFFNPQLEAWLIRNSFNLTPQSFLARWKQIENQLKNRPEPDIESLTDQDTKKFIKSAIDSKKERQAILDDVAEERYKFYTITIDTIREIIGKNGDAGKLKLLENSGLPCERIREKLEELRAFLTDEFEKSTSFWYVKHYRCIKNFKESLEKETDYLKKKLIHDIFFDEHFELKRCQLFIANQIRNSHQEEKELQRQIDEFISRKIGLPQGDLSLEIAEAGHMETYYILLKESGKIAAVFTGWPQKEEETEETIFYTYLCASHPELPGLGLGTRLHEHFFDDNEMKELNGEFFYKKFIGAVNPFGMEAYFHIHRLGAICKAMIERNKYIAEKFSYYGGITPHRFIAEFSKANHKLALERFSQATSSDNYTPKAYPPPIKENMICPGNDFASFHTKIASLGDNESIVLTISVIKEKFHNLNMTDYEKQELARESSVFYDHCLILFEKGYQIIDCYHRDAGEKVDHLGYVFTRCHGI